MINALRKNKAEKEGRGKGHSEGTSEQRLEQKAWILGKCNHKMKLGVYGSWRNDSGEIEGTLVADGRRNERRGQVQNNNAENMPGNVRNITLTTVDKSHHNPNRAVLSACPFYRRRSLRLPMSQPSSIHSYLIQPELRLG